MGDVRLGGWYEWIDGFEKIDIPRFDPVRVIVMDGFEKMGQLAQRSYITEKKV